MSRKLLAVVLFSLWLNATASPTQDIQTKGAISGIILDSNGGMVPQAKITITGQKTPERIVTSNAHGVFEVENLTPGFYNIKAEQTGFKITSASRVQVFVGKTTALRLILEAGLISEVVDVTESSAAVDQSSTAISENLNDQLYQNIPLERSVTSVFYLAPGVTDSLGGGIANPSISGGSPLDNLYIADGVNITDPAFGGLGIFSRVYGTLGVGINTSFIKEVQVKTAGFEAQYGQSQGGIVNIITQSGGNEYHGAIYGFARPKAFEATRRQADDFSSNKLGKILHQENYDAGVDGGGYVPRLRNNLFFFGSFNPTVRREIVRGAARNANDIANGRGRDSGLFTLLGDTARRYRTFSYAFKLDYIFNQHHAVAFSIFGDPTKTNLAPLRDLNIDNTTADSKLDLGTRNLSVRYNGSLSSSWTISLALSQGTNHFDESGFANFSSIFDTTQPDRGTFRAIGRGALESSNGQTYRITFDTTKEIKLLGTHTFGMGYQYQRALFAGKQDLSGPRFTIPATNATGLPLTRIAGAPALAAIGQQLSAEFGLFSLPLDDDFVALFGSVCSLCPFLNIPGIGDRRVVLFASMSGSTFDTKSTYHAGYLQDTWRVNRHVTALLGLRTEQERIRGTPVSSGSQFVSHSFTDQWAPRLGLTVDPFGRGKTKVYYNFGRFFEYIPLDLAERSLSIGLGVFSARFAPDFFIDATGNRRVRLNEFGTVTPIVDADHLLNRAVGGFPRSISISTEQDLTNSILPGTKLGFAQEHLVGFEQQLPHGFVLSARYLDRHLKRIVEDATVVAPEATQFFGFTYFIGNISSKLDGAVNPISHVLPHAFVPQFDANGLPTNLPQACDPTLFTDVRDSQNNLLGFVCYEANGVNGQPAGSAGADGVPDGFPDAVHIYHSVEIELNKRFSDNWQLLANWRIASLRGNFEGHFRNDNGQDDPAISSLFDFTEGDFGLLGDQNRVGPLNTDRRHVVNIYGSYAVTSKGFMSLGGRLKGLNLGSGLHMESGLPISEFLAHPVYGDPGEVPVGGRGKLGRTPFYFQLDLHADYPWQINERLRLRFITDFFNVTNNRKVRLPNQFRESENGQLSPDFLKPQLFHLPFNLRVGIKLQW